METYWSDLREYFFFFFHVSKKEEVEDFSLPPSSAAFSIKQFGLFPLTAQ